MNVGNLHASRSPRGCLFGFRVHFSKGAYFSGWLTAKPFGLPLGRTNLLAHHVLLQAVHTMIEPIRRPANDLRHSVLVKSAFDKSSRTIESPYAFPSRSFPNTRAEKAKSGCGSTLLESLDRFGKWGCASERRRPILKTDFCKRIARTFRFSALQLPIPKSNLKNSPRNAAMHRPNRLDSIFQVAFGCHAQSGAALSLQALFNHSTHCVRYECGAMKLLHSPWINVAPRQQSGVSNGCQAHTGATEGSISLRGKGPIQVGSSESR